MKTTKYEKRRILTNESFIQSNEEEYKIKNGLNEINKQSLIEEKKRKRRKKMNIIILISNNTSFII